MIPFLSSSLRPQKQWPDDFQRPLTLKQQNPGWHNESSHLNTTGAFATSDFKTGRISSQTKPLNPNKGTPPLLQQRCYPSDHH